MGAKYEAVTSDFSEKKANLQAAQRDLDELRAQTKQLVEKNQFLLSEVDLENKRFVKVDSALKETLLMNQELNEKCSTLLTIIVEKNSVISTQTESIGALEAQCQTFCSQRELELEVAKRSAALDVLVRELETAKPADIMTDDGDSSDSDLVIIPKQVNP